MKITFVCFLLQSFAFTASSGNFLYRKTGVLKKRTQMHVNLECSPRKYKSTLASNFENHLNVVIKNKQTVIFIKQGSLKCKNRLFLVRTAS